MATPPDNPTASQAALAREVARLTRRLERERAIRLEAEVIAEKGLRDLYQRQGELQMLERIAARANQDNRVQDVLQFALEEICRFHDWKAGHGYTLRQEEGKAVLVPAGIWFATDPTGFKPFHRVSGHTEFAVGHGLPGRAYRSARPIWISDLGEDHDFPRLGVGLACGLRSAVAFPVLSGKSVVAVLEFFDTETRICSESLLEMLAQVGTQLGRVIERQQAEAALQIRAEELARALDQAEAADRAKSAFLAAMSHELRTPLNAIIGFSEIMQHEIAGSLSPRYKEYAGDIQRSGIHLRNVINDILDLSKVVVGALSLREAPVSLIALIENCTRIISPMAANGQVALTCTLASDLPVLQADETRLQQTILNLLSNAVKFTHPLGKVMLDVARERDGGVAIAITDTGIGMSREDIAIALEPFRQIDSALSRRYEGTGLGLPLAKAFIELHGGALVIDSTPNIGTTVRLLLPPSRCMKTAA